MRGSERNLPLDWTGERFTLCTIRKILSGIVPAGILDMDMDCSRLYQVVAVRIGYLPGSVGVAGIPNEPQTFGWDPIQQLAGCLAIADICLMLVLQGQDQTIPLGPSYRLGQLLYDFIQSVSGRLTLPPECKGPHHSGAEETRRLETIIDSREMFFVPFLCR